MNTVAHRRARSAIEAAATAPAGIRSSVPAMSKHTRPGAAMTTLAAIGPPILPRPMKPMVIAQAAAVGNVGHRLVARRWRHAFGVEHLAGQPECLDTRRHAGVHHHLDQRVAQFVECAAVAQRTAEVQLELVRAVERGEDAQVVEAALLIGERAAAPHAAPAVLGDHLLHVAIEAVGGGERLRDELRTEHSRTGIDPGLKQ